ncbi:MAG: HEAT repeat domain-containing protein [Planctomycetota bacterium]|nr:HEAT repeat domain-containing protein [Planctomycetota bacterium]
MHRAQPTRLPGLAALALVGALLAGCQSDPEPPSADRLKPPPEEVAREGDRPYYRGTPRMQQDIRDLMGRVPNASHRQWADIARKLTAFGEPAVPQLIANLNSCDTEVQLMSAYVLGMIKDPRSLDALQRATVGRMPAVRYEAATAMLRMGDRRGLLTMVDALESPDPLVRARAILVLRENTGETFDYKADDVPGERAAAVARWRAWMQRTGGVTRG